MSDHYLKFSSEAAAKTALEAVGLGIEDRPYFIPERVDIHSVGPIDGADFHVNLRGSCPLALFQYAVFPTTPRAVWA